MKKYLIILVFILISRQISGADPSGDCHKQSVVSVSSDTLSALENPPSRDKQADGPAFNRLGFRYYESGDYPNAIGCYKEAITLSPDYPVPLNNLGVIYLKSNQLELAHECFKKAIDLKPEYIKAICNLAVVCYKMGNIPDAKQFYEMAMRIDSSYVERRIENYIKRNQ